MNVEVIIDALNKTQSRGFGFATFKHAQACKDAHAKYFKDKLKILVSKKHRNQLCCVFIGVVVCIKG